jgi:hypothetical protein
MNEVMYRPKLGDQNRVPSHEPANELWEKRRSGPVHGTLDLRKRISQLINIDMREFDDIVVYLACAASNIIISWMKVRRLLDLDPCATWSSVTKRQGKHCIQCADFNVSESCECATIRNLCFCRPQFDQIEVRCIYRWRRNVIQELIRHHCLDKLPMSLPTRTSRKHTMVIWYHPVQKYPDHWSTIKLSTAVQHDIESFSGIIKNNDWPRQRSRKNLH